MEKSSAESPCTGLPSASRTITSTMTRCTVWRMVMLGDSTSWLAGGVGISGVLCAEIGLWDGGASDWPVDFASDWPVRGAAKKQDKTTNTRTTRESEGNCAREMSIAHRRLF